MIYLASPYTHSDSKVEEKRFTKCIEAVHYIQFEMQLNVFSPILHCHPVHAHTDCGGKLEVWKRFNIEMIRLCTEFYVLCLSGWEDSRGVLYEIGAATGLERRIVYFNLDDKKVSTTPFYTTYHYGQTSKRLGKKNS